MVCLGVLYDDGDGVKQDHARANTLYREAVEVDNNTSALYNLGNSYLNGRAVEQNVTTALSFWQRAADLGFAVAQYGVGGPTYEGRAATRRTFRSPGSTSRPAPRMAMTTQLRC
jgi:hypothetical protein